MRFLNFAIHYPKPEHVEDLLGAMYRLADAANAADEQARPLQMAAFHDQERDRIVAISIWPSPQVFQAAAARMMPVLTDTPFDHWERSSPEIYALVETPPASRR